jgi:hypothetical protein
MSLNDGLSLRRRNCSRWRTKFWRGAQNRRSGLKQWLDGYSGGLVNYNPWEERWQVTQEEVPRWFKRCGRLWGYGQATGTLYSLVARFCGMVTQASKSRSAVNENMENPMVRDENINHLPYVVQDTSYHELYTADPDNQQHDIMLTWYIDSRCHSSLKSSAPSTRSAP